MEKVVLAIVALIILGILWALPVYVCGNLVLYLFHVQYHLSLLQSFSLCLLANVISNVIFTNKEDK